MSKDITDYSQSPVASHVFEDSMSSVVDSDYAFFDLSPNKEKAAPGFNLSDQNSNHTLPVISSDRRGELPGSFLNPEKLKVSDRDSDKPFSLGFNPRLIQNSCSTSPVFVHSEETMEVPLNFNYSVPQKSIQQYSPAASYVSMKSDQLMDPPTKFIQDVIESTDELSSTSTLVSVQSEKSIEPPLAFICSESSTSLMMQEHLRCSLCKYIFKEPVTIPCGHSFCKNCISYFWTKTAESSYHCPQCRKRFKTFPVLNLNFTLANVVLTQQQVKISAPLSTHSYARSGDVACDSCSGNKLKAVKSCQTCLKSFCETHVRQHYTVEGLSKHILKDI